MADNEDSTESIHSNQSRSLFDPNNEVGEGPDNGVVEVLEFGSDSGSEPEMVFEQTDSDSETNNYWRALRLRRRRGPMEREEVVTLESEDEGNDDSIVSVRQSDDEEVEEIHGSNDGVPELGQELRAGEVEEVPTPYRAPEPQLEGGFIVSPVPGSSSSLRPPVVARNNEVVGGVDNNGSDVENDDDLDDGENGPPPQKMPRLDTSMRSENDEDGFICTICYENFTNSGSHRVCCLKCGHVYGKECIEKWIQAQKRCPQCNCKAAKRDIRVIYVKNLKVVDTAELDRMKEEMDKVKIERNRTDLSNAQLRVQVQLKNQEITRLEDEVKRLRARVTSSDADGMNLPSTSKFSGLSEPFEKTLYGGLRMPKLNLTKHFDIKEGQCRVGAYNEWMNLLVVSHAISTALFPGGCFGIKKINCFEMKAVQSIPIHQKALRDMTFSLAQNDVLLTVGLDKKAVLFNCNSNCPIQTINTEAPLWSCCWNSVNQNVFYVGTAHGQIMSYDMRTLQTPVRTLILPTTDKSAVARLKFVPPPYPNANSFNMSGLLIQKLNSVWFSEMLGGDDGDPRYHQLPLEGPFFNADFESSSRHVLISSRPKSGAQRIGSNHAVCALSKMYSETEERHVFSCDVVQSITTGFQEASVLCRSAIFSPHQGQVYVAANGEVNRTVRVWDVANLEQKSPLLRIDDDAALDFVHGAVNENSFLSVLTGKSMDVYSIA